MFVLFIVRLLLIFEVAVVSPLMAQKIIVEGRIVDKGDALPIDYEYPKQKSN